MQDSREQKSPYKTTEEAAAYIRKGLSTFRGYVRRFGIPRRGPAGDRFLVSDLDAFMADCTCFHGSAAPPRTRDRTFKPVKI